MVEIVTAQQQRGTGGVVQIDNSGVQSFMNEVAGLGQGLQSALDLRDETYVTKTTAEAKAEWQAASVELRNGMAEDGAGYTAKAQAKWKEIADAAVAKVPAASRNKLRENLDMFGIALTADADVDAAAQRGVWQSHQFADTLQIQENRVAQDPSLLDDALADMLETIDGLPLPPEERLKLTDQTKSGMTRLAVEKMARDDPHQALAALTNGEFDGLLNPETKAGLLEKARDGADAWDGAALGERIAAGSIDGRTTSEMTRNLIAREEGFRDQAYPDWTSRNGEKILSGHRAGYGSDTITLADGTVQKVVAGETYSKADLDRDLDRRSTQYHRAAAREFGAGYLALPPQAQAAIMSLFHNYGEGNIRVNRMLGEAINSGMGAAGVANAIEALQGDNDGINKARRLREAALARSGDPNAVLMAEVEGIADPRRRANIMRAASMGVAQAEAALASRRTAEEADAKAQRDELDAAIEAQSKALELANDQQRAGLDIGLARGAITYEDLETAYASGILTPDQYADRVVALDTAIEKGRLTTAAVSSLVTKLAEGGVANPFDKTDRDAVDSMYSAEVARAPEGTTPRQIGTRVAIGAGVAPAALTTELAGGIGRGDVEALTAAAQILDARPQAFDQQGAAGAAVTAKASEFAALTGLGYTAEEAAQRVARPALTESERAQVVPLVTAELKDVGAAQIAGKFGGWFGGPDVAEPHAAALSNDYKGAYRQARMDGMTPSEADATATARVKARWGESEFGGGLMRFPPERYYPEPDLLHDEIANDLKSLGLPSDGAVLLSDGVTDQDIRAGIPPRYRVLYRDADGNLQQMPGYFQGDTGAQVTADEDKKAAAAKKAEQEFVKADRQAMKRALISRGLRASGGTERLKTLYDQIMAHERATGRRFSSRDTLITDPAELARMEQERNAK